MEKKKQTVALKSDRRNVLGRKKFEKFFSNVLPSPAEIEPRDSARAWKSPIGCRDLFQGALALILGVWISSIPHPLDKFFSCKVRLKTDWTARVNCWSDAIPFVGKNRVGIWQYVALNLSRHGPIVPCNDSNALEKHFVTTDQCNTAILTLYCGIKACSIRPTHSNAIQKC